MKRKFKKNKDFNINQKSFYFEDYLETNIEHKNRTKSSISQDRIYILFFFFFCLISIYCIKILFVSFQAPQFLELENNRINFLPLRRDIVDRNGTLISRNIQAYHAAIKPWLVKDKKKFLLNIKVNFPKISQINLKKKLKQNKYFYLKKRLSQDEKNKLWALGQKGLVFEEYQARIYPQGDLYSHILGQIDIDNYGISGIEKSLDNELIDLTKINKPLKLSLDTNIQYLIKKELEKSVKDFKTKGAASLLIDSRTGEIISLISLPDYNINLRKDINQDIYTNKITKGLYELGSVFKTLTVALAFEENLFEPESIVENITKKIRCSKYVISDIHEFPKKMKVEDILIQSSNIGAVHIARKIGEDKYKNFLNKTKLLETPKLELDEVSSPLKLKWNKCKLETVSYGHGIMTSPLQMASAYSAITNGGYYINPTLRINNNNQNKKIQIISANTSKKINKILRKVVVDKKGTASLANIFGYEVGGKTGTAQNYQNKKENINTFVSIFPTSEPRYVLLVLLENPQPAPHIIYNYRGNLIRVNRNEAGWNSVYVAGKIIQQIGPILAINNTEVNKKHVVQKIN
jgi:cell division protein FtsI (penicillin-binding protein 3)